VKLRINRAAVAMFGIVAYLIARRAEGVSAIVEMASAFGSAGILVTVSFGLFTRIGGAVAAMLTIVTGVVSFVGATLLGAATPFLISLGASLGAYLLVAATERWRGESAGHGDAESYIRPGERLDRNAPS
jgi:hypothetical protein